MRPGTITDAGFKSWKDKKKKKIRRRMKVIVMRATMLVKTAGLAELEPGQSPRLLRTRTHAEAVPRQLAPALSLADWERDAGSDL